jgi:mono/diheme cytochrome c family protein
MAFCPAALFLLIACTALRAQPPARLQHRVARNPDASLTGDAENGKKLYASVGCATCHGISAQGSGTIPRIGPTQLALRMFVKYVRQPSGSMRAFPQETVSDEQLADIFAFLSSLSPQSKPGTTADSLVGNAEKGKQLFTRDGCYECHGLQGQGSSNYGPRLGPDPVPPQAIMNYIRRPAGNMPPYTAKLVSDQDVADIYEYLKSVARPVDIRNIPLFK